MKIESVTSKLDGAIHIPGSKSHTIRAFLIALLSEGTSIVENPLLSHDTLSCLDAIQTFGAHTEVSEKSQGQVVIKSHGVLGHKDARWIDVGNSGTTLRLLTSIAALQKEPWTFDGDSSIRERPMAPLLNALESLGAKVLQSREGVKCPFSLQGPIKGGEVTVDGTSSQFLSSLLIATPLAQNDTIINVTNLNEVPYVQITLSWLDELGIEYSHNDDLSRFVIKGGQSYRPIEKSIPGDFSTACFPLCAAAITGSELTIKGLDFDDSQGDKEIFKMVEKMGIPMTYIEGGVRVEKGHLKGCELDLNDTPDALPIMSVLACFAEGETRLVNVAQARIKECDRIAVMNKVLSQMGASVQELPDGLVIQGSNLVGTELHGHHDHRVVMAISVAGLAAKGRTVVDTAEAAGVTYPNFVSDMKSLGAKLNIS